MWCRESERTDAKRKHGKSRQILLLRDRVNRDSNGEMSDLMGKTTEQQNSPNSPNVKPLNNDE